MALLSGLLPGLRELRAPLAAGFLWLAVVALTQVDALPVTPPVGSVTEKVYALAAWMGSATVIAVLSFVAYFVGMLSTALTGWLLAIAAGIHRRGEEDSSILGDRRPKLSTKGLYSIRSLVEEKLAAQLADASGQPYVRTLNAHPESRSILAALSSGIELSQRRAILGSAVETAPHVRAVVDDLPLIPNRLLGKDPDKYSAYDRQVVEGEFRAALALPALALGVAGVLQSRSVWVGALTVVVPTLLFLQARQRTVAANDQLAEFLRSGSVDSPRLAELQQAPIRLTRSALDACEVELFRRLARGAEEVAQLDAAVGWYKVLAATGDRGAHEKVCDLTRAAKSIYSDADVLLEPLLVEGSQVSGRLALEAIDLYVDRLSRPASGLPADTDPQQFASDIERAIVQVALWATRHDESSVLGERLLEVVYGPARAQSGDFESDLRRVGDAKMSPFVFLAQYPLPDVGAGELVRAWRALRDVEDSDDGQAQRQRTR
jgi:hypothetical protein